MTAKLFCKTGQLKGASYVIADEATIGKDSKNTITLTPTTLSRYHATIFFDANQNCYFLQDLDSRNGTRLDGLRVIGTEKLRNLHIITFANDFDFIFQVTNAQTEKQKIQPPQPPVPNKNIVVEQTWMLPSTMKKPVVEDKTVIGTAIFPLPQIAPVREEDKTVAGAAFAPLPQIKQTLPVKIFLLERVGADSLPLKEGENSVGRETTCTIQIQHPSLSRQHAVVKVANGIVTVSDLGSKNKTAVNGKVIESEIAIVSGTEVRFGQVTTILKERV